MPLFVDHHNVTDHAVVSYRLKGRSVHLWHGSDLAAVILKAPLLSPLSHHSTSSVEYFPSFEACTTPIAALKASTVVTMPPLAS